jgi:hypothetical protein
MLGVSTTVVGAITRFDGSTTGEDISGFGAGDLNRSESEYRVVE